MHKRKPSDASGVGAVGPNRSPSPAEAVVVLHALAVLVFHRARLARGSLSLGQDVVVLDGGAVDTLLEDWFGFVELELGLEVAEVVGVAAAIRTTSGVDKVELLVDNFLADIAPVTVREKVLLYRRHGMVYSPIAFSGTVLLRLLGVDALEAVLGEEFGKVFMRENGALGETSMVLIVELVRSSHCKRIHCQQLVCRSGDKVSGTNERGHQ